MQHEVYTFIIGCLEALLKRVERVVFKGWIGFSEAQVAVARDTNFE
jgi:hypothetical protein